MRRALVHLKSNDPVMAGIIASVGPFRMVYQEPGFSALARSILYQQVSGASALSVVTKLLQVAGRGDQLMPRRILRLGPEGMRACGVSRQKAAYLTDLAEKTVARELRFDRFDQMTDDEVIEMLTRVKGIGVWTAHMFLIFALRRPDVMPVGDLGVRNAIMRAYGLPAPPTAAEMLVVCEKWRPWCSVASWYLWRSLDGSATL